MKLNGTPRHYMPLSQNQSDDEETGTKAAKCVKSGKIPDFSDSFDKPLNLPKLPTENKKRVPMTFLRTLAFLFSLCMCIAFIAAFLLLVPCRPEALGIGNIGDLLEKWTVILPNISFSSDAALALTGHLSSPVLVFGYFHWENDTYATKGVVAVQKYDGTQLWKLPLHSEPTSILCNSIDVNSDGVYDCLISGRDGLLTAIDVRKGINIWYIHSHKGIKLADNMSSPTVLPDCDKDGVPDLAVSYAFFSENAVFLTLISGATGEVIGTPVSLLHCTSSVTRHMAMNMKNKTAFIFFCTDEKTGQLFLSYAEDICDVALNRTESMRLTVLYRSVLPASDLDFQMLPTTHGELAALFGRSKIALLSPARNGKLKVKWQKMCEGDMWNVVAYGSFLKKGSPEVVLLSRGNSASKLVGLDIATGKEVWSGTFNNSRVTAVFPVPSFFREVDGLVLKTLKHLHKHDVKLDYTVFPYQNISNGTSEDVRSYAVENATKIAEESFILIHVQDLPKAKIISSKEVIQHCEGIVCQPDIYTTKRTAVPVILANGEVDVCMVTSSATSRNSSLPWAVETSVKLVKIEKFSKLSKCMYNLES